MEVISSCSNSLMQCQRSHSVESCTRLWQRTDLVSCFAQGSVACCLELRGALCHSFKNASLWPPLFVHTALTNRGPSELVEERIFMPSSLGHGLYKKKDRLKNIFCCIQYNEATPTNTCRVYWLCGTIWLTNVTNEHTVMMVVTSQLNISNCIIHYTYMQHSGMFTLCEWNWR